MIKMFDVNSDRPKLNAAANVIFTIFTALMVISSIFCLIKALIYPINVLNFIYLGIYITANVFGVILILIQDLLTLKQDEIDGIDEDRFIKGFVSIFGESRIGYILILVFGFSIFLFPSHDVQNIFEIILIFVQYATIMSTMLVEARKYTERNAERSF